MSKLAGLIQEYCPDGVTFKSVDAIAELKRGTSITKKSIKDGDIPVIAGGQKPAYYHNHSNRSGETIVVAGSGAYSGFVTFWSIPIFVSDAFTVKSNPEAVMPKFLFYFLKSKQSAIHDMQRGGGVPHVYAKDVAPMRMPVPPLEVQKEIVNTLDKFTQFEAELSVELDARRKQYEYYRRDLMTPNENVKYASLEALCTLITDGSHSSPKAASEGYYMPSVKDMRSNGFDLSLCKKISKEDYDALVRNGCKPHKNDVLIAKDGSMLKYAFPIEEEQDIVVLSSIAILRPNVEIINPKYLAHYFGQEKFKETVIRNYSSKGGVPRIVLKNFKKVKIPIPPHAKQNEIVTVLDKFEALMSDISGGLPAEITARRKQYEYYRTKLLTFQELPV